MFIAWRGALGNLRATLVSGKFREVQGAGTTPCSIRLYIAPRRRFFAVCFRGKRASIMKVGFRKVDVQPQSQILLEYRVFIITEEL